MKYRLILSDRTNDKRIEMEVVARSVFDAIDHAAEVVDHPEEVELVEATPVLDE